MYKQSQASKNRKQTGNALILVCMSITLSAFLLVVAYSFAAVYFVHNRLQSSADEIALAGARKLNQYNRLGQMNDMIARSRQLVYSSRKQYEEVAGAANNPLAEKLAQQLVNEARDSAQELETERRYLTGLVVAESGQAMQNKFNQIKGSYAMVLPWLVVETPQAVSLSSGKVSGMQSNAQELEGFDELVKKDRADSGKVYSAKPVNLYCAERPVSLPTVDSQLPFNFSPLSAPVTNDMAPARLFLSNKFEKSSTGYAPCATKVDLVLKVATGLGPKSQAGFKVSSAASATGGGLWQ